jgi:hypothetical protein
LGTPSPTYLSSSYGRRPVAAAAAASNDANFLPRLQLLIQLAKSCAQLSTTVGVLLLTAFVKFSSSSSFPLLPAFGQSRRRRRHQQQQQQQQFSSSSPASPPSPFSFSSEASSFLLLSSCGGSGSVSARVCQEKMLRAAHKTDSQ